jgi:nitroreductase
MNPVTADTVLKQMQWRYATKKFDPNKKISDTDWKVLEQAMVLSPSSYGLQPWKFFLVSDPDIRAKLPALSWNQTQVVEASHLVVMAIRKNLGIEDIDRYLERIVEVRGGTLDALAGYKKMMVGGLVPPKGFDINAWATQQVYIALGTLMTAAAMLGIDSCPMEGFQPAAYDELLGLPAMGYGSVVLCPLGYRAADDKYAETPKVRFKTEDVVMEIKAK